MGKTGGLIKKITDTKGTQDRNVMDLTEAESAP